MEIGVPPLNGDAIDQARWALGCMAYSPLRDLVALTSCRDQEWARVSPDLPHARAQLPAQARAYLDEIAQAYVRHGFALAASGSDQRSDLVIEPLTEEAPEALRHAMTRGTAR